jgi:hypothetical protein
MLKAFMRLDNAGFFIGEYDENRDILDNAAILSFGMNPAGQTEIGAMAFPDIHFKPLLATIEDISKKTLYSVEVSELDQAAVFYWKLREKLLTIEKPNKNAIRLN